MRKAFNRLSVGFSGGILGVLPNSLVVWLSGIAGITTFLGAQIAPALTAEWLYPRLVWGGLWGLLFALPWRRQSWLLRGFVYSLAPTGAQLLFFFPVAGQGILGLKLGPTVPLFVVAFNAIWGIVAGWWAVNARSR
jgi:hypothetical protein